MLTATATSVPEWGIQVLGWGVSVSLETLSRVGFVSSGTEGLHRPTLSRCVTVPQPWACPGHRRCFLVPLKHGAQMHQHKTSFLNSSSVRASGEDGSSQKVCVVAHSSPSLLLDFPPPELTDNKLGVTITRAKIAGG